MLAAMSVLALLPHGPSPIHRLFRGHGHHCDGAEDIDGFEFYGSYSIYAEFENPSDVISALYSDVESLGTPYMGAEMTCGCFESPLVLSTLLSGINTAFLGIYPEMAYHSGWTIGMSDNAALGEEPSLIGDISSPCAGAVSADGSVFIVPQLDPTTGAVTFPSNAVAGDDSKILVARITTCGAFTFQACVQTFPEANQDSTL